MGYASDHMETPFGQRIPVYFVGCILTLPSFFLMFNPPDFAIGTDEMNPRPWAPYFFVLCALMQIGKGGMQLAHLSILNSITYDQKRRDMLINYRNSVAYAAGLIVPLVSFFMFQHVTSEQDQFAYICDICLAVGLASTFVFLFFINEPKLVRESRNKYNEYIMVPNEEVDSHGKLLDLDDDGQESGYFGTGFDSREDSDKQREDNKYYGSTDGDDIAQYLEEARKKASRGRRETVSVGGANYLPKNERAKTPVRGLQQSNLPSDPDTMSHLEGPKNVGVGDIDSVPSMDYDFDTRRSKASRRHQKHQKKSVKIVDDASDDKIAPRK